jgi:hypothetical protein
METAVRIRARLRSALTVALTVTLAVGWFGGAPAHAFDPTLPTWSITVKIDDPNYPGSPAKPRCMEVAGQSGQNGATIQMYTCASGGPEHQIWQIVPLSGGRYHIVNVASDKCLNVLGASTQSGAKIIQWTCGTTARNDEWYLVRREVDYYGWDYYQLQNVHSGACLNVQGNSWQNGTDLIQYPCGGSPANSLFNWHYPV